MPDTASDLARRLAENAEAVCRHYLSNGRREGRWWTVGDVHNAPGRSMMVRLQSTDRGPAGKWTDAATGEHGDLLDLIASRRAARRWRDTLDEARRFLSLPRPDASRADHVRSAGIARSGAPLVRHVRADPGHHRRSVSARSRHYGFAGLHVVAVPSALLLPWRGG